MKSIYFEDVNYHGTLKFPLYGSIKEAIVYDYRKLEFGKCYCIDSDFQYGGWAISWIASGKVNQQSGSVYLDGRNIGQKERKKLSQCVGFDMKSYFSFGKKTIRKQIANGLKRTNNKNAQNVDEIIRLFDLSPEKVDRTIEQVSVMRYKASMAIGFAYDRKIYCFPWFTQELTLRFKDLWLKKCMNILKEKGYLIILPTPYTREMSDLFDDVQKVKG